MPVLSWFLLIGRKIFSQRCSSSKALRIRTPVESGWHPEQSHRTVLDREALADISSWCTDKSLHLLVDEIYHGLHYVDDLPSVLEIDDSAFVVNSFSKYFGMTGWRLGWIVVPDYAVDKAKYLLRIFIFLLPPSHSTQHLPDLRSNPPDPGAKTTELSRAPRFLCASLRRSGSSSRRSAGCLYVYADISAFSENSEQFCHDSGKPWRCNNAGTDFGDFKARNSFDLPYDQHG